MILRISYLTSLNLAKPETIVEPDQYHREKEMHQQQAADCKGISGQ